jgi:hypothetical protein
MRLADQAGSLLLKKLRNETLYSGVLTWYFAYVERTIRAREKGRKG